MTFPIFEISLAERMVIYNILDRYPEAMARKLEIKFKLFGISIHPSVSVKGLVADLIGEHP